MQSNTNPTNVRSLEQEEAIPQGKLASQILAVDAVEAPKRIVKQAKSKYFYHWLRVKPEELESVEGPKRLGRGNRNVGCVIVHMDYLEPTILGKTVADMSHANWVELFRDLGVFNDVYQRLGLTSDERSSVAWKTNPKFYFSRNKFGSSHWQFLWIQEEHPHLKIAVLSLSALVAEAEAAQEAALDGSDSVVDEPSDLNTHPPAAAG